MTQALARNSDPAPSHHAAARARQFAPSHHEIILAALREHGPMAANGIAKATGLRFEQVDRRRCELVRMGLVRLLDDYRQTMSGGWSQVMEAV